MVTTSSGLGCGLLAEARLTRPAGRWRWWSSRDARRSRLACLLAGLPTGLRRRARVHGGGSLGDGGVWAQPASAARSRAPDASAPDQRGQASEGDRLFQLTPRRSSRPLDEAVVSAAAGWCPTGRSGPRSGRRKSAGCTGRASRGRFLPGAVHEAAAGDPFLGGDGRGGCGRRSGCAAGAPGAGLLARALAFSSVVVPPTGAAVGPVWATVDSGRSG